MSEIVFLDGGMGQELVARSAFPPSPLWSANVMMNEPEIVEAVHRDYIEAGAKVLTLNAYSATPERLARDAREDLFEPLQRQAISIIQSAADGHAVTLGGCLSPLFGSYHPENTPDFETCLATYRRIVALQEGAMDVMICETLASVREIKAAVTAASEAGCEVWCGMTTRDEDGTKLRSGESLLDGAMAAKEAGAAAVAVNCSWPEAVAQALPELAKTGLPFGGWANGFTNAAGDLALGGTVDGMGKRTDLGPDVYAEHVMGWVEKGATLVGGCCEVGPAHIAQLSHKLTDAGHTLVGRF